jgi:hypothetical protein
MPTLFLSGVPLGFFALMYFYRAEFHNLVMLSKEDDAQDHTTTLSRKSRRPSHHIEMAANLGFLASKVKKFQPECWWTHAFQIGMRIIQTSAMVFLTDLRQQAVLASVIALMGISVQRNTAPYRRPSE